MGIGHPRHPAPLAHRTEGKHSLAACCQNAVGAVAAEDDLPVPMSLMVPGSRVCSGSCQRVRNVLADGAWGNWDTWSLSEGQSPPWWKEESAVF